ncbi:MAG TPA: cytochrome c [Thermoanaerobaculia bacterium]|jgi:mono/diheme cytochrome c family protein|nr:cytochrome c [Thermoanaerobaculia bacterium]
MKRHVITAMLLCLVVVLATPLFAADGAALYKTNCTTCHGPTGAGDTPAGKMMKAKPLGSAEVQKLTDAEITASITNGKNKMPKFGQKLSAEEIKALVAYVRTFKK